MSPILFGGSENRDESGCHRPVEDVCKIVYSKHALRAYDDCYHRAIQRTLFLEHRRRSPKLLIRGGFSVIIRHTEGDDVRDGITEGDDRVDTGWRRGKGHELAISI